MRPSRKTLFKCITCLVAAMSQAGGCKGTKDPGTQACQPSCGEAQCGDDGCGGECLPGCSEGLWCDDGVLREATVLDKEGLLAVLDGIVFYPLYYQHPIGSARAPVTGDLRIQGTITIELSEIEYLCDNPTYCTFAGFGTSWTREGIVVDDSGNATFTDVTVRFMGIDIDHHPGMGQTLSIRILPPSCDPCTAEERKCYRDYICYEDFGAYCAFCTNNPPHGCACLDWDGRKPIGSDCYIALSPDNQYGGTCDAGGSCQMCSSNSDCWGDNYCWANEPVYSDAISGESYWVSDCLYESCTPEASCGPESVCCGEGSCVADVSDCP